MAHIQRISKRGHNRKAVFLADENYQFYLENLKEWKVKLGVKLYAWCLMTNHVHLILEPGDDASTVSELMKRLAGRQAAFVKKLEGRSGALWEEGSRPVPYSEIIICLPAVDMWR